MLFELKLSETKLVYGSYGSCVCIGNFEAHNMTTHSGWADTITQCFKMCCIDLYSDTFSYFPDGSNGTGKEYLCSEALQQLLKNGYRIADFRTSSWSCSIQ